MIDLLVILILILLATFEARFPSLLLPSVFLIAYILWILKSRMRFSRILFISFFMGIILDAADISHVWLYPFFMPFTAWLIREVKLKINLSLSPVRVLVFTLFCFIMLLPVFLYYSISFLSILIKSFITAFFIEGVLVLLWRGELE